MFLVNPDLPEACSHITTGASQLGTPGVHAPILPTQPYPNSSDPSAGDGCAVGGSLFATPGTAVMPAGGMTFRVNWASGSPVLEYTTRAPPLPTDSWTELSQDVEQMTVVLGVTNLVADGGVPGRPGSPGGGRRRADRRLRRDGRHRTVLGSWGHGPAGAGPHRLGCAHAARSSGRGAPGGAVQPAPGLGERRGGCRGLRARHRRQPGRRTCPGGRTLVVTLATRNFGLAGSF